MARRDDNACKHVGNSEYVVFGTAHYRLRRQYGHCLAEITHGSLARTKPFAPASLTAAPNGLRGNCASSWRVPAALPPKTSGAMCTSEVLGTFVTPFITAAEATSGQLPGQRRKSCPLYG
jgi:hypothetical protein